MSGHHGVRSFVMPTCQKYNDAMRMPEQIETERLVLRKPRMDDAYAIFAGWTQDTEVTRYLTWHPHQRIEQTKQFLQKCLSAWEYETRFPYVITLKGSDEIIGMIDPRIEGPKMGIGYGAARAHWGKGYVAEPRAPSSNGRFGNRQSIASMPRQTWITLRRGAF